MAGTTGCNRHVVRCCVGANRRDGSSLTGTGPPTRLCIRFFGSGSSGSVVPVHGRRVRMSLECLKGVWWMPWRIEAMKDVARCDKPRGAVSRL